MSIQKIDYKVNWWVRICVEVYIKLARCIQELERIKGVRHGNNRFTNRDDKMSTLQNPQITQEDIAKQFGVGSFNERVNNRNRERQIVPHGQYGSKRQNVALTKIPNDILSLGK